VWRKGETAIQNVRRIDIVWVLNDSARTQAVEENIYRPNWTLEEKVRRRKSLYHVKCKHGQRWYFGTGKMGKAECSRLYQRSENHKIYRIL